MVVTHNFKELYETCSKPLVLNLPAFKETPLQIHYEESNEFEHVYSGSPSPLPFADTEIFYASICESKRLTALNSDCKAVYELTFDISGSYFSFKPGDTIGIIPHNDSSSVNFILDHLNLSSQAYVPYLLTLDTSQKGAKIPPHIPVKSTLRNVLENCVDLRSVLKKLFLLALSRHTKDEDERRVLEFLCSKEGASAYTSHILNKNVSILDLLSIFESCKPPIEILLSHLPRLLPRPYSIVNSYKRNPNELKICFSVMDLDNNRKGLTTGWLERIILDESSIESKMKNLTVNERGGKIPIYVRKNITGFSMPENVETPLILIGAGTGISPFIGFLEERQHLKEKESITMGGVWVFFGCRNSALDFIYEEELKNFLTNGTLSKICTAFSRMDNSNAKYVQDAILQNSKELVKWINNGASIFVCGDAKTLAPEVKAAIQKCLIQNGASKKDAVDLLADMVASKTYLVDIWS